MTVLHKMIDISIWRARIGTYNGGLSRILSRNPGKRRLCKISIILLLLMLCAGFMGLLCHGDMACTSCETCQSGANVRRLVSLMMGALVLSVLTTASGDLERSIAIVAILLIMAGDVEQNPGPTGILEIKDLVTVQGELQGIASKWKDFGLQLKMIITTLEEIGARYHSDPSDCLRETIKHWLTNAIPSPTWEDIALGLESNIIKEQAMADKIRTKYCSVRATSSDFNSHKRKRGVETMSKEQRNLTVKFHCAVEAVTDEYVELHGNNTDRLKRFLACFSHPDDLLEPFIPATLFANAANVTDVVHCLIPRYINIMHISILQSIVERFGTGKTSRILHEYEQLSGNCKIRDYPNPVSDEQLGESPCMKKLKLSTSRDYDIATVSDVHLIQNGVATATKTNPGFIVPVQKHPGSLVLVFLVPSSTCLVLHSLQKDGLETLANCGILRLEIDDLVIDDIQKYKTELATVSNHTQEYFLSGSAQPGKTSRKVLFSTEKEDNLLNIIVKISPKKFSQVCQDVFLLKVSTFITNLTSLSNSLGISDARKKEITRMSVTRGEQSYNLLMEWKSQRQDNATNGALLHCLMLCTSYTTMEKTLELLFGPESTRSQWKAILEARRKPFSTEEKDCLLSTIMKISPYKFSEICDNILLSKVSTFITNLTNLSQSLGISDTRKEEILKMDVTRGEQSYKLLMEWKIQKQDNATNEALLQCLLLYAPYATMEGIFKVLESGIRKEVHKEKILTTDSSTHATKDKDLSRLLRSASEMGNLDFVKYLIDEHHIDPMVRDMEMSTPLHFAAVGGSLSVVKYLITEKNCSPIVKGFLGRTPLHCASISNHLDVVKYITDKHHVDPLIQDDDGDTPFHLAALSGSLSVVKYFITEKFCSPIERGGLQGRTPLHYASDGGHLDVMKYLINKHKVDPLIQDRQMNTPLHLATAEGSLSVDLVEYFVTKTDCSPVERGFEGRTPLHQASCDGNLDVVKYLIDRHHVDPHILDGKMSTPLHYAALGGSLSVVNYFITEKDCSSVERGFEGTTSLHQASEGGHLHVVKYLIDKHHVDPLIRDKNGNTPLHSAALKGKIDVVKYFMTEKKCCSTEKGFEGRTPLHQASGGDHLDVVKYLIDKHKANPMIRDERMNTPLHLAALGGSLGVVKYFITKKGCNPLEKGFVGRTPLHHASEGGHLDVVKYLIDKHNVDPMIRDKNNNTPLHSAALRGRFSIVKYLIIEKGCQPMVRGQLGLEPIGFACIGGHLDIVHFLVEEQHIDPICYDDNSNSLLHWAALSGHLNVLVYLIDERKCSPFIKGQWGRLPLHHASQGGFLDVVKYLVEKQQVNPVCVDNNGITPHALALSNNHGDITQYLSRANISSQPQHEDIEKTHHSHAREHELFGRHFPQCFRCR